MRPEPLRRSLGLWFPAWALPAEVNTPPRRSRSAALRMTRQNNKEYYVCSCGAWIYADKVKKGMATHCQQCWRPWPKPRPSFTQWPSPAPKPPNQQRVPFPSPKPRSRPRRVKGAEVWKEHWDSLPTAVQDELKRQGVDPRAQKEEEEEDPLLKLLQELKDDLPVKLQLELAKREPPAPSAKEQGVECSKKLSQATGRLKGLVRKQLGLQETINETKEALRILLKDMGDVNAEIVECQKQVEEAKKELSAVVGETGPPAPDNDPMDIDTMLGKIGVTLTEEQQEALREQIDQNKKRRLSPLPFRRPEGQKEPEQPPGLERKGPPDGAAANPSQDRPARSRSPKNLPVPGKEDEL